MKGVLLNNSKWQKTPTLQAVGAGGFTLIELLLALAISSIVMAAIYSVYASLTRSYTTQNVAADVQQVMRAGIDFMVEDIMLAGFDRKDGGFEPIAWAAADKIIIQADHSENGIIDNTDPDNPERITYFYDVGNTRLRHCLYEGTVDDWETLIDNVANFAFNYLDANGTDLGSPVAAANRANIRTVVISMTVQEPAGRGGPVSRTYTTQVRCRNLDL